MTTPDTASMTSEELAHELIETLLFAGELDGIAEASTFAEAGVLTMNDGIVVRFRGGSEFQLTIVRSR